MEREQKCIGSKERFFLATGGWNENKNALDLKKVSFWLLVDGTKTKTHWILRTFLFWLLVDGQEQKRIGSEHGRMYYKDREPYMLPFL